MKFILRSFFRDFDGVVEMCGLKNLIGGAILRLGSGQVATLRFAFVRTISCNSGGRGDNCGNEKHTVETVKQYRGFGQDDSTRREVRTPCVRS